MIKMTFYVVLIYILWLNWGFSQITYSFDPYLDPLSKYVYVYFHKIIELGTIIFYVVLRYSRIIYKNNKAEVQQRYKRIFNKMRFSFSL